MNKTIKIIHLSDTHIDPVSKPQNSVKLNYILQRICAQPFDHLVVTGDLTHAADRESLAAFRGILKNHGLLRSELTTVVPGNHDIYGTVKNLRDVLTFPRQCVAIDFAEKLRRFAGELGELFEGADSAVPGQPFPFVKSARGAVFIGLNTSRRYSISRNLFADAGQADMEELRTIGRFLEATGRGGGPRILLSHHGIKDWGRIRGFGRSGRTEHLRALRASGAGLVLHGHDHWMSAERRDDILTVNAGGTLDDRPKNLVRFYEADIGETSGEIRLEMKHGDIREHSPGSSLGHRLRTAYEGG